MDGNPGAVPPTIHTYIYGVTTGRKKRRTTAPPVPENADFFWVHAPVHNVRVTYIYGVKRAAGVRYAAGKPGGAGAPFTGTRSLTSAGGTDLRNWKFLSEAARSAKIGPYFTYRGWREWYAVAGDANLPVSAGAGSGNCGFMPRFWLHISWNKLQRAPALKRKPSDFVAKIAILDADFLT